MRIDKYDVIPASGVQTEYAVDTFVKKYRNEDGLLIDSHIFKAGTKDCVFDKRYSFVEVPFGSVAGVAWYGASTANIPLTATELSYEATIPAAATDTYVIVAPQTGATVVVKAGATVAAAEAVTAETDGSYKVAFGVTGTAVTKYVVISATLDGVTTTYTIKGARAAS